MKTKLLSLMTLLLIGISSAWGADVKPAIEDVTASNTPAVPSSALNLSSQEDFSADANGWIVFYTKGVVDSKAWWSKTQTNGGSTTWTAPSGTVAPFKGAKSSTNRFTMNLSRVHAIRFTGAEKASFLVKNSANGGTYRKTVVSLYTYNSSTTTLSSAISTKDAGDNTDVKEIVFEDLSASTDYVAYVYGNNSSNSDFLEVALKAPVGAVDPVFSLTKTTIGTDETSQIQVGSKGDLDGITFDGDVTFGTSGVVTVNAAGVVTPVAAGTTTINFNTNSVDAKYNASTNNSLSITVTAPVVATPVISPADGKKFITASQEVTITCATDDADVYYTLDGTTPTSASTRYTAAFTIDETKTIKAIAIKEGYTDSEVATATITKYVLSDITSISAATEWDFTTWNQSLELTASTVPTNKQEATFSDIATLNDGINLPSGFNGDKLSFVGQYPISSKRSQAGTWKFHTDVPGILVVHFADTGSSGSSNKRYLTINEEKTSYYADRGASTDAEGKGGKTVTSGEIAVAAGDVVITGHDTDDNWIAIRVMKIIFTPATKAVTTNAGGWASFTPSWNATLSTGATAYIITKVTETAVTAKPVEVLKAGEGYFVKGTTGSYTATATAEGATDTEGNMIVGTTTGTTINGGGSTTLYVLGTTEGGESGLFKVDGDVTVAAGKAYLDAGEIIEARVLSIGFDEGETTGVVSVGKPQTAGNREVYNLNGQRVAQPTKGLYIVNGRKVVIK